MLRYTDIVIWCGRGKTARYTISADHHRWKGLSRGCKSTGRTRPGVRESVPALRRCPSRQCLIPLTFQPFAVFYWEMVTLGHRELDIAWITYTNFMFL